jgi:hypothetical protein
LTRRIDLKDYTYRPGFLRAAVVVSTNSNASNARLGTMLPTNACGRFVKLGSVEILIGKYHQHSVELLFDVDGARR